MSDDVYDGRADEEKERKRKKIVKEEEQEVEPVKHSVTPNAGLNTIVDLDSDRSEIKAIIADYYTRFGGRAGYKPPIEEKGCLSLSFPNKGDALSFFGEQAQKGRKMTIIDAETGNVMAYSNGLDGTLYHADGSPYDLEQEIDLQPSDIKAEGFSLPNTPRLRG